MRIVEPSFEILFISDRALELVELAARTCYKSEDRICEGSAEPFIATRILGPDTPHMSVLEHSMMSVRFIVDRGVSHELVRHRMGSVSQESTRYCNYSKDKFGGEIAVIKPMFWAEHTVQWERWKSACEVAELTYFDLLRDGATPQEARSVLPTSLKTELVFSANFRQWRHVFEMRTSVRAHPQMRQIMCPLLVEAQQRVPLVFAGVGH